MMFNTILSFILFWSIVSSYKILGVFPTQWKSHWSIGTSVIKQLNKDHEVTLVSPFEFKENNVRNVILTNFPKDDERNLFDLESLPTYKNFLIIPEIFEAIINFTLAHPNMQQLMSEQFDAVIVEIFHSEALLGLGAHFNCPVIGVTTFGTSSYSDIMTSTPHPTSYVPNLFHTFTDKMSFRERLINTILWKTDEFFLYFHHFPKQRRLYEKYFPHVQTSFEIQRKNLSLLLNNNHMALTTVRPYMPNTIDIAGITVQPIKPLPRDIQEFLDSAHDGAILFSMGSMIQAVNWPEEKREAFVKAFKKLKQKIIWKYENETLPNKPENVMIGSWIPQRDILAHRNIKAFISHGGLLGVSEALTEGIPILSIPIYGDQKMNMNLAVSKGYAVSLSFEEISEETITQALKKVLSDSKLSLKAKEVSRVFTNRPLTPQNSVSFWVDYVITHNGAYHLIPAAHGLNYFELNSLDVYGLIFTVVAFCLVFNFFLLKFLLRKIIKVFTSRDKKQNKMKWN